MKKANLSKILTTVVLVFGFNAITFSSSAQDVKTSQVPSLVLTEFQKLFPKAVDIDWEMDKDLYEVEFEIGRDDHKVWFDQSGVMVKHKEELSSKSLPSTLRAKLKEGYKNYWISDVERLTKKGVSVFKVELKNLRREIDIFIDEKGNEIQGYLW